MSRLIAAAFAASLCACFNPQFQQGVPCTADGQCPEGQVCHTDDRCYDPDQIPEVDPDATLSSLEISQGTLVPAFDPQVTEYTVELGLRVDAFTVTPTAAFPEGASIEVAGSATDSGAASIPLDLRLGDNAIEVIVTADDGDSATYSIAINRGAALAQTAYIKASNAELQDCFGGCNDDFGPTGDVAISGDTLAVVASKEDSDARVVNGDQTDDSSTDSGAIYVFVRDEDQWTQQAYIKPSSLFDFDRFGTSRQLGTFGFGTGTAIALDGDTLIAGTHDLGLSQGTGTGRVYVFVRSGNVWTEQAIVEASNAEEDDLFGMSVAISGDTLAVGAPGEDSNATGINQNESDNSLEGAGAVYTFVRNGSTWQQEAYIKASNSGAGDAFGGAVDLDGETLVVGSSAEDSNASTVNGNQASDAATDAGAAYVFSRAAGSWVQQAYLKAPNSDVGDFFGSSVGVSADTIVIGAPFEDSQSRDDEANDGADDSGAAYVFTRTGSAWFTRAYLKSSNIGVGDHFGESVAISSRAIAIGTSAEDSGGRGVGAIQDDAAENSGGAYLFVGADAIWAETHFIKASNTDTGDRFGAGVALSENTLVVVAPSEASAATGVNPGETAENDNSASNAGAAYVFE